jgi:hypothetical protein
MPELPIGFHFTQGRLQDYLDCQRRFQLRYLLNQPWPAQLIEQAEPFEQHIEQGRRFHRLVHQYFLGLAVEVLDEHASEFPLERWWKEFLSHAIESLPSVRMPEFTRGTILEGVRFIGKFDLVALDEDGTVLIVDWKTSRVVPSITELRSRMQSRLYPFILAREGLNRPGFEEILPDQISMRYWYAEDPENPREIGYRQQQYIADTNFLCDMVHEVRSIQDEIFPLTEDARKCRFCLYRSLCDRGVGPAKLNNIEADFENLADWVDSGNLDQTPEMEF